MPGKALPQRQAQHVGIRSTTLALDQDRRHRDKPLGQGHPPLSRVPRPAHIKVVLITARAQEDDKTRGGRVGADAYLTKPFDPNEMIRVVRELAGAAPLAPPNPP